MPMSTSLAPGYCRITYTGVAFPHHMTVPVNYDGTPTPGSDPDLIVKGGTTASGEAKIVELVDTFLPFFPATTHFGLGEFHTVDSLTGEDQFIYAFNIGLTGSSVGTAQPLRQFVMTFKTTIGSLYRLYFMETDNDADEKNYPPFAPGPIADLADYITGAGSPVYGRGNAYPFAAIAWLTKTNDKLRKQQGLA